MFETVKKWKDVSEWVLQHCILSERRRRCQIIFKSGLDFRKLTRTIDIDRPLKVYGGKKFHMRVHVLASGTLQVYVHQDVIALISSEEYVRENIENRFMRII